MKKLFLSLFAVIALGFAAQAESYGPSAFYDSSTNSVSATSTNAVNAVLNVEAGTDVGLYLSFKATGATPNGVVVAVFDKQIDSTHTNTIANAFRWTIPATGTTNVSACTNLSMAGLGDLVFKGLENTNGVAITNVYGLYGVKPLNR